MKNQPTLHDLIEEYKQMASICYNIDYSDKKSTKANNKAVSRMYQIVAIINTDFGENGVYEFAKLVEHDKDGTNLWASVQMLEKMPVDEPTEKRALAIIKQEAKNSLGMEYWLKTYLAKDSKTS